MHCSRRAGGLCLLVLALTSLSVPAAAQPRPEPPPAAEGDAAAKVGDLLRRGRELYASGKKQQAYEMFKAAWDIRRSFDVAGNLGIVALELGKMREAAEYLSFWKANAPVAETRQRVAMIEARLAEARKEVAAVRVEVRRGGGSVGAESAAGSADGATVLVDGKVVGRAPLPGEAFLDPGKHAVKVRLPGYADAQKVIEGRKGFTETVTLVLEPIAEGDIALSGGGAGKGSGSAASQGFSVPVVVAGIGVAVTGLVVGGVFAGLSNGKRSESVEIFQGFASDPGACSRPSNAAACEELYGAYSDTAAFKNVAITGFVVGGAAAIATGVYVLLAGGARSPATSQEGKAASGHGIQATFGVSPRGGGVSLRGVF